ncbi:MAG: acetate uptake transporter family protein [Polyangiales bacterium]
MTISNDSTTPPVFGEPTPLGLLGLAIGCASLVPIAFGWLPSEPAKIAMMLKTAAWFCLLFGAGCQFLAGVMSLANKNTLGGTLLTTFSFNWVFNWFALDQASQGKAIDATVGVSVDVAFLVIFVVLTYAFGFFSKLLFVFLLDIDLLYFLRLVKHFAGHDAQHALGLAVGFATIALGALSLYIALAMLLNPAAGRVVLPIGGALFKSTPSVGS